MDLSTIKRNIENGVIRTTVEFQRDMLLMVQNAIIYNKFDTPVYDMAKAMGEDMLAQMEVCNCLISKTIFVITNQS